MRLILGSQSPSRRLALENAGYEFEVMPADIDEKAIRDPDHRQLPLLIARAKAAALLSRIGSRENTLLITGDQVVECAGEMREKPESPDEARRFLASYRTEPAQTNSAVAVTNLENRVQAAGIDIAHTFFRPLPDEIVDQLVVDETILNSAGAFLIEHSVMESYVERIEGTPDSVMGLPMRLTERLMGEVVKV